MGAALRRRFTSSTEDRVLLIFLGLLFALSVAVPVLESLTDRRIPPSWTVPVILAALYAILRLVGAVPEIRTDVRYLREVADVRVQRMPNVKEFYESLDGAVRNATSTLDLTHIRDTPPGDFGDQATRFFAQLVDWCTVEGRSARRIICVRNPAMLAWARQLADETRHLSRFSVRVVDWSTEAPAINMAIVDGKAVYLALTGATTERTRGLGIEDEDATQYFSDYYDNLWRGARDLDGWLARDSREGA